MEGRYVTVAMTQNPGILTLCEVVVHGTEIRESKISLLKTPHMHTSAQISETFACVRRRPQISDRFLAATTENLALNKPAIQSSTWDSNGPEKAVNGQSDTNFNKNFVCFVRLSQTQRQSDLASSPKVYCSKS